MKKTTWPGNYKFTCHVCGFWYPSGEIKRRWDGVYVCSKDWEPRHPQTLIKIRGERAFPDVVSKDASPDIMVHVCDIRTISPYASMGTAGCMRAGVSYGWSFLELLDFDASGHGPGTFLPGPLFDTNPDTADFALADIVILTT
jgi:hypothetical protein